MMVFIMYTVVSPPNEHQVRLKFFQIFKCQNQSKGSRLQRFINFINFSVHSNKNFIIDYMFFHGFMVKSSQQRFIYFINFSVHYSKSYIMITCFSMVSLFAIKSGSTLPAYLQGFQTSTSAVIFNLQTPVKSVLFKCQKWLFLEPDELPKLSSPIIIPYHSTTHEAYCYFFAIEPVLQL